MIRYTFEKKEIRTEDNTRSDYVITIHAEVVDEVDTVDIALVDLANEFDQENEKAVEKSKMAGKSMFLQELIDSNKKDHPNV